MALTAQEHIRKFERDWMQDLISDHPDVGQDDLYHDGLQAYMAQEDMTPAVRKEISRMTGVPVGF